MFLAAAAASPASGTTWSSSCIWCASSAGFGYLAFSGVFFAGVRRHGDASLAGALEVNRSLSQLAELLLIAAFVFGIAAVGASPDIKFSQGWVGGVIAAWVVAFGILHGWIRRTAAPLRLRGPGPAQDVQGRGGPRRSGTARRHGAGHIRRLGGLQPRGGGRRSADRLPARILIEDPAASTERGGD